MGNGMKANITSSHTYNLSDTFTKAPTSMEKKTESRVKRNLSNIRKYLAFKGNQSFKHTKAC